MGRQLDPLLTDLDLLTAPISPEHPCGDWLRYEGIYEQIRETRREDDATLPQGVWQAELKRADWGGVEELCANGLAHRTKDLQLAAWLLEAWIQLDGFAGAARGIELMRRLCADYWDNMYPALNQDLTARLAPIQWVNEKLPRRLRMMRLTRPSIESVPAYSLADWEVAMRNPGDGGPGDVVTMAKFQQSVAITSYEWFLALKQDVLRTIEQVRLLDELIDQKAGKLSPGLLQFRGAATAIEDLLDTMLSATINNKVGVNRGTESPSHLALATGSPEADAAALALLDPQNAQGVTQQVAQPGAPTTGLIRTRAEAYRLLAEIADFLQKNDPHSPTPYLIWRAVAWGDMRFNELLPELLGGRSDFSDIVKLLRLDVTGAEHK